MTASSSFPAASVLPVVRYRDLTSAMAWLEQAFDFEQQVAVSDADGNAIFAQVRYGPSVMMLGAVRDTDIDLLMCQPDEIGGLETQSCYVVVADIDQAYDRAVGAGADIALPLQSDGLGRRGFSCRDPEGHLWSFGTYKVAHGAGDADDSELNSGTRSEPSSSWGRRIGLLFLFLVVGAAGWGLNDRLDTGRSADLAAMNAETEKAYTELARLRAQRRSLEAEVKKTKHERDAEKRARTSAEARASILESQLQSAQKAAASANRRAGGLTKARSTETKARKSGARQSTPLRRQRTELEEEKAATQAAASLNKSKKANGVRESRESRLETSATRARVVTEKTLKPVTQSSQSATAPKKPAKKATTAYKPAKPKKKKTKKASSKRPKSTYVLDLAIVPWPHKQWNN